MLLDLTGKKYLEIHKVDLGNSLKACYDKKIITQEILAHPILVTFLLYEAHERNEHVDLTLLIKPAY